MQRYGAKKRPYYRMVATDKRSPRDGRFIEMLGTYDPLQEPPEVRMNSERFEYWLSVGAQPTDTVRSLIRQMRRGDVVDLSQVGADEAARKELAEQKRKGQEALRAKISKDAKAAEAKAKAEAEAKKAEAEAKKKAEAEAKEAEAKAEEAKAEEAEEPKAEEAEEPKAEEAEEAKAEEAEEPKAEEAEEPKAEESEEAEDASDEEE
jgi:small subunit ribosomal protein S16